MTIFQEIKNGTNEGIIIIIPAVSDKKIKINKISGHSDTTGLLKIKIPGFDNLIYQTKQFENFDFNFFGWLQTTNINESIEIEIVYSTNLCSLAVFAEYFI